MNRREKLRRSYSASAHLVFRRTAIILTTMAISILAGFPSHARLVELTILHTTDLHGYIWPTTDYDGRENVGGFLRCASMIDTIRAQKENVVLIDCGDTFQGAPENYFSDGKLLVEGLNWLGYDAWILGNHEFDWGWQALRRLHDLAEIPFLAANLNFKPGSENWLPKIKPYVIKEVHGVKVAIVGLVTPGIPRWSRPYLLNGAMFKGSLETLADIMPRVKSENPDLLVVAVHQGYKHRGDDFANEIQAIAKTFPEIDVLLGGHTHTPVVDMRMGPVLYSQAGYHGIWLGQIDVTYDTVSRSVQDKTSMLHLMDDRIVYHEFLLEKWSSQLAQSSNRLSETIGVMDARLETRTDARGNSPMQHFICKAIADGTGADFVLHGSLSEEAVGPGVITYGDVWRMVPYENTIGIIHITPARIREILEENFSRPVTFQSLGAYGFTFELKKENGRAAISDLRDPDGHPLHSRKHYRVALNSYVLASGGERYLKTREIAELPESRLEMLDVDTRELVANYIRNNFSAPVESAEKPALQNTREVMVIHD